MLRLLGSPNLCPLWQAPILHHRLDPNQQALVELLIYGYFVL